MATENVIEDETFMQEAFRIIDEAEERGITLRLLGSIAFRIHCPKYAPLLHKGESTHRPLTDIDYMAYNKHQTSIRKLMYDLRFREIFADPMVRRIVFQSPKYKNLKVDFFLEQLRFCHTIDFDQKQKRLEVDKPTIPLEEMLLEKMQIVEINEKDIKDTIMLVCEHDIDDDTEENTEVIDGGFIARILADDWGFWYTVTTNLNKTKAWVPKYSNALSEEDQSLAVNRINKLLERIDQEEKTKKWRKRAKTGTKKRWYEEVQSFDVD
ncbi:MAG: hypothetical protein ACFFCD_10270 [Promethearchaeota archaeon]